MEQLKSGITINGARPVRKKSKKVNDKHHQEVKRIIFTMRKKYETFDRIAEYLEVQGIPTLPGRGKWHAQTVHRLYEDYGESL